MSSINKNDRHKLYWYKPTIGTETSSFIYQIIDVSRLVAQFISDRKPTKYLGLDVEAFFKELVRKNASKQSEVPGIILQNFGILLEPELSLNVPKILLDLSQELAIILHWEYEVEYSRRFFWDSTTSDVCLEFPEHTIRRVEIENEV